MEVDLILLIFRLNLFNIIFFFQFTILFFFYTLDYLSKIVELIINKMKLVFILSLIALTSCASYEKSYYTAFFKKTTEELVKELVEKFKANDADFIKGLKDFYSSFDVVFKDGKLDLVNVKVSDLFPTQKEISLGSSLGYYLKDNSDRSKITKIYEGKEVIEINESPLLLYKKDSKYYIIDGHHRWSQVYLINKESKMSAYVIDGSYNTIKDALNASHLAIATKLDDGTVVYPTSAAGAGDDNLLLCEIDKASDKIECKGMEKNFNDILNKNEIIAAFVKDSKTASKEEVKKLLIENAKSLRENNNCVDVDKCPIRVYMPQTDKSRSKKDGEKDVDIIKETLKNLKVVNAGSKKLKKKMKQLK